MQQHAEHDNAEPRLSSRYVWAKVCYTLAITSPLLLVPLALSFFLWVYAWTYQLEGPILTQSQMWSWDVVRWLYVLGPEIILALLALIIGIIAIARWRKTPGWKHDEWWVKAGLTCAVLVLITYGIVLWFGIAVLAGTAL